MTVMIFTLFAAAALLALGSMFRALRAYGHALLAIGQQLELCESGQGQQSARARFGRRRSKPQLTWRMASSRSPIVRVPRRKGRVTVRRRQIGHYVSGPGRLAID